ncbi:hypothetical protein CPB86DRAFT_749300 [Serendipita vermifera]|nr:hypothetical protein CPB86DRAFT_749300 [Serendipita vermifera]
MLIEEKKLAVKLGQEEGAMGEQPPAYSQVSTSPPVSPGASTSSEPTIPPPSNFVHVFKRDANINGTWHIDPSLTIPAAFSSPVDAESNYNTTSKFKLFDRGVPAEEQQRPPRPQPNLLLHTRDGRINADVWLRREPISGQDVTKPTIIDLNSKDGNISLRLVCISPPTHIQIQTSDGHIRVFLPHTFQGPISHVARDGKVVFSPKMQPHVTPFSIVGKKGKSFLGDWRSMSIPEPDAKKPLVEGEAKSEAPETPKDEPETPAAVSQWKGDSCEVETHDGSIYFYWEEEYEEAMTMKGWFRSLFW